MNRCSLPTSLGLARPSFENEYPIFSKNNLEFNVFVATIYLKLAQSFVWIVLMIGRLIP